MRKVIFGLGLSAALFSAPAFASGAGAAARNYVCTDTSMKELRAEGAKMTDESKKSAFMKEMDMADSSMASDATGCADHMKNLTNMLSN